MGSSAAVFGIGHPDRGDDAVGLAVAARVAALALPSVTVVPLVAPLELIDMWTGYDLVVVVDAMRSGAPAGTVTVNRMSDMSSAADPRALNTHALGLADAFELARALDRLPGALVVVGIELDDVRTGAVMSPPVCAAADAAVDAVVDVLTERLTPGSG